MPIYGQGWSVPYGDPQDFLLDYIVTDNGSSADIDLQAASGYSLWWATICDGHIQEVFYLPELVIVTKSVVYDPARSDHAVSVYCLGSYDTTSDLDPFVTQTYFEEDKGAYADVQFAAVMAPTEADNDAGQFSAWSLTGLTRFATSRPGSRTTQAKLDIIMSTTGGVHTVSLQVAGVEVASGSRTGDGSITFTATSGSGLSGFVTLAYSADLASAAGAYVCGRWCAYYTVTVGALSTTVRDSGRGDVLNARLGPLAAGSAAVSIQGVSDTGIAGSTYTGSVTLPGRPAAPGALSVVVPGAWNGTDVSFAASATAGATYALFESDELDGPINHSAATATHIAGTGTITWTLPNLSGAAAGKRRIMIVALNGGVEDGVRRSLTIEYDASGNVVGPRPNVPGYQLALSPVSSGRTISARYVYDAAEESGVATTIKLYLVPEPYSSIGAGETPVALATKISGIARGALTGIAPANGWYKILVRAATALSVQSDNADIVGPVFVSDAVPAAPGGVAVTVTG